MSKICKVHGELKPEDIQYEKIRWSSDGKVKSGCQTRCRLCRREKDRRWKVLNRQKHIESSGRWKKANRDRVNAWAKEDRKNNPEKYKLWSKTIREKAGINRSKMESIRVMGITIEYYEKMVQDQNNECAICFRPETRKSRTGEIARLCIDHCHETGTVRGLLCHACNIVIGQAEDSIPTLISAINYLQKFTD